MSHEYRRKIVWVVLFSIAMGWLEATVVVYLRMLYYPEGLTFPLKTIPWNIGVVELGREAATILMLIALAMLAGRRRMERFAYLMMAFGIWDIVYYISLRIAIGWPESFFTWDLLFLLPLPWIGPVIAPLLVSMAMILAGIAILFQEDVGNPLRPSMLFWVLEILCGLTIIASFMMDYRFAFTNGVPARFRWEVFLAGYLPGIALFFITWRKTRKSVF